MKLRVLAAALLLAPLAASTAARAQPCTPHLLGADRRGPVDRIARTGSRVFLAAGAALVVVDAADLVAPTERGYVNLDGVVRDVAAWGWTVVAVTPAGLTIVDASDPDDPRIVGLLALPAESEVGEVAVGDGIAYYPAPDGLHVVDLHDPAHPMEIRLFAVDGASDVALRLDRAYLLAGRDLLVLDISDPAAPSEVASVPAPGEAIDHVTVGPGGAHLATWGTDCLRHCWGEAALFDLDDPDFPVERSVLPFYDDVAVHAVALGGGNLYVNFGWTYGEIHDISDPAQPVLVGTLTGEHLGQMTTAPDPGFLFAADRGIGLRVFDVTPPGSAHPVAAVGMPSATRDGFFSGSLAVTVHEQGVRVFDLSDPSQPAVIGSWSFSGETLFGEVAQIGDYAYASSSDYPYRFRIFDLSDPTHPAPAGTFGEGYAGWEAPTVVRDLMLLTRSLGLRLFDVVDPAHPEEIGVALPGRSVYNATAAGERAFAWTFDDGDLHLRAFDISVPQAPVELGSTILGEMGRSLAYGSRLFVNGSDQFWAYDVSDPSSPRLEGSLTLPSSSGDHRIALYGSRATLGPNPPYTWGDRLVRVLDISDPAHPLLFAEIDTRGDPRNAFAGPGRIGIADGEAGFAIYDSCVPFADGFESGDASAWSVVTP